MWNNVRQIALIISIGYGCAMEYGAKRSRNSCGAIHGKTTRQPSEYYSGISQTVSPKDQKHVFYNVKEGLENYRRNLTSLQSNIFLMIDRGEDYNLAVKNLEQDKRENMRKTQINDNLHITETARLAIDDQMVMNIEKWFKENEIIFLMIDKDEYLKSLKSHMENAKDSHQEFSKFANQFKKCSGECYDVDLLRRFENCVANLGKDIEKISNAL